MIFGVVQEDGTHTQSKKGQKKKKAQEEPSVETPLKNETRIHIPLDLISKAHLAPEVMFEE